MLGIARFTPSRAQGRRERSFCRPAPSHANPDHIVGQARPFCRVLQAKTFSAIVDKHRRSPVPGLLSVSGPADVAWPVAKIVVYSINAVLPAWARANVAEEGLESSLAKISWVNVDPAAAPQVPFLGRWVGRPLNHRRPYRILRRRASACLVSMRGHGCLEPFVAQAPAGLRGAAGKLACCCDRLAPAITAARPHADRLAVSIPFILGSDNDSKSTKPLTFKIDRCGHA